jgi:hypothetical protein
MQAYKKAIETISSQQNFISVIDIGCARCAFINEFLIKYFDRNSIKSIGIDPLQHSGIYDASKTYNIYVKGCVDNIPKGSIEKKKFYVNSIDQASSLLKIKTDNFSSDMKNYNSAFYYPQDVINKLAIITNEIDVDVYNLNDIINKYYNNNDVIDFIKIDAEGKDLDIAKSIIDNLYRIKYIGVECSSHKDETLEIFENGSKYKDVIEFFSQHNFEIFEITDYSLEEGNYTQMCDIVFINSNIK